MSRKYPLKKSFGFAFEGLKTCLRQEPNFRIHSILAIAAVVLAFYLEISRLEWIGLVLVIGLVFATELVNTSIEAVVNLLSPEKQESAKIAKDVGAAAVLFSAITALVVGALLFIPKFF